MSQSIEDKKSILAQYNYKYEEFHKLEELRGCPIALIDEDKLDVQYDEYCSDELRKIAPYVTIWMITYNHEKYIAKAIEGVVKQECNFPIELIIVEDHSSDETLNICKRYQELYPKIVHLFTAKERKPFQLAIILKSYRMFKKIFRGKYLAFCEGDDWWSDVRKLQMQVDVLEKYPEISLCFTSYIWYEEDKAKSREMNINLPNGIGDFNKEFLIGEQWPKIQTAGLLVRSDEYFKYIQNDICYKIILRVGDVKIWLSLSLPTGKYYVINKVTYTYNQHPCGASYGSNVYPVTRDVCIVRYFYCLKNKKQYSKYEIYIHYYFLCLYRRILMDEFDSTNLKNEIENFFSSYHKNELNQQNEEWTFLPLYNLIHNLFPSKKYRKFTKVILKIISQYDLSKYKKDTWEYSASRIFSTYFVVYIKYYYNRFRIRINNIKHRIRMVIPERVVKYGSKLLGRHYTPINKKNNDI